MKVDLKKALPSYGARHGVFEIVEIPPLRYLMVDGHGDPNAQQFADAITTLYSVAYPLKFLSKRELDRDYVVMPLEALWWADDMAAFSVDRDKSRWDWTAMILTPDWITDDQLARATAAATTPAIGRLRIESLEEGRAPDASRRAVRRGRPRARSDAPRVHPGSRAADDRPAPRDLPQRSASRRPRQARTILRQPVGDACRERRLHLGCHRPRCGRRRSAPVARSCRGRPATSSVAFGSPIGLVDDVHALGALDEERLVPDADGPRSLAGRLVEARPGRAVLLRRVGRVGVELVDRRPVLHDVGSAARPSAAGSRGGPNRGPWTARAASGAWPRIPAARDRAATSG